MTLPADVVALLAIAAAVGVVVLSGVAVFLAVRLSRLRRAYGSALDPARREDLFQAVQRQREELGVVRDDLAVVHDNTEHLRRLLGGTLSRVGVVRYDAFPDMGGAMSFSAALLDEHGNGLVISAINGRSETRCYAKSVVDGASEHNLSDEEAGAIRDAVEGGSAGTPSRRGRRRAS